VHLGRNIPRELLHHANLATAFMPPSDIYLIANSRCDDFPGVVIFYDETDWDLRYQDYLSRFPEISETDDGYWDVTLRRLLVLGVLGKTLNSDTRVIHLESDVMLLLPINQLTKALENIRRVALPRLGEKGIASFLYFPNTASVSDFCENILETLDSTEVPLTDMKILGIGLTVGWLVEIPSVPKSLGEKNDHVIFDGAAIGQYLFGVNPIHTSGKLTSGFQNQYFPLALASVNWQIEKIDGSEFSTLVAEIADMKSYVACLHVHSKELLPVLSMKSERWTRAIFEANGGERLVERRTIPRASKSQMSIKGKLIKARRIGLLAVVRIILRRFFSSLN
jgi:hypothetical protein